MPTLSSVLVQCPFSFSFGTLVDRDMIPVMSKKRIKIKDIARVVYHETLPPELMDRIAKLWPLIEDGAQPRERFEATFLRDKHPEDEVAIWERIAKRYSDFKGQLSTSGIVTTPEDRQYLLDLITVNTTGDADARRLLLNASERMQQTPFPKTFEELLPRRK